MGLPKSIVFNHTDQIVERARLGDERAFNELVSQWYKRIYNFCYKYSSDYDSASDSAQKTFIKVYDHLGKLEEPGKFKSWLYIIALNVCREESRREVRVSRVFVSENDECINENRPIPAVSNSYEQNELADIVIKSLNQLSKEQKEVILMKEYEGLKFREIAEVLNESENTVKSRLYYGLNNMKKILVKNRAFQESYEYEK